MLDGATGETSAAGVGVLLGAERLLLWLAPPNQPRRRHPPGVETVAPGDVAKGQGPVARPIQTGVNNMDQPGLNRLRAQDRAATPMAKKTRDRRRRRRTPEFSAWLAALARGPVCERWRSFSNFYRDTGRRPTWAHLLIRTDPTGAFEPSNARWQIGRRYRSRRSTAR
jgi:hypothetical protein